MKRVLGFCINLLIVEVFGYLPQQQHHHQWGQPEWGPPPQSETYPGWNPNQQQCRIIPTAAKTTEITPIVEIGSISNSIYPCDSNSIIKQISILSNNKVKVTCNGVIVSTNDGAYDVIYADNPIKQRLEMTNLTAISTFNNGNRDYLQCGTIASGRCAGDNIWGTAIDQADDQTGCFREGHTGDHAIFAIIQISGKCASKCSLGRSTHSFNPPVNNRGLVGV